MISLLYSFTEYKEKWRWKKFEHNANGKQEGGKWKMKCVKMCSIPRFFGWTRYGFFIPESKCKIMHWIFFWLLLPFHFVIFLAHFELCSHKQCATSRKGNRLEILSAQIMKIFFFTWYKIMIAFIGRVETATTWVTIPKRTIYHAKITFKLLGLFTFFFFYYVCMIEISTFTSLLFCLLPTRMNVARRYSFHFGDFVTKLWPGYYCQT